jgi:3-phytase
MSRERKAIMECAHGQISKNGAWIASFLLLLLLDAGCIHTKPGPANLSPIRPLVTTEPVRYDTDDPAIWINSADPSQSLIVGVDKDPDGALYVFGLDGKTIGSKTVHGLKHPNNVDVEYHLMLRGKPTDIAVVTERETHKMRVFRLPDMEAIDNGGIDVFSGQAQMEPMGVGCYRRPSDDAIFVILSRKGGPANGYLWQYRLEDDGDGFVKGTKVREFGLFSGKKEIEAVAVDDSSGYVYYADEQFGVRKYAANPDAPNANDQLALFATTNFTADHEGISVYEVSDGTGYIIVSDQAANTYHIFKREGERDNPHDHKLVKIVRLSTKNSDGSDVTSAALNVTFPAGMFVSMSDDKTFQLYSWKDIAGTDLIIAPDGRRRGR